MKLPPHDHLHLMNEKQRAEALQFTPMKHADGSTGYTLTVAPYVFVGLARPRVAAARHLITLGLWLLEGEELEAEAARPPPGDCSVCGLPTTSGTLCSCCATAQPDQRA
jgi:hypothetical protein